jgi:protein-tyrosine phosphatase
MNHKPTRVLFVCLGNICRSPTAEVVFRRYVEQAGLEHQIEIDSAGTGDYHIGEPPDERARDAASRRGYDLSALRARQVTRRDFEVFDYLLAMDEENARSLKRLAPHGHAHKVILFTDFGTNGARYVPDPYAGGVQGFEHVLDLVEDAARGLLRHIESELRRQI